MKQINSIKARQAAKGIDALRRAKAFAGGKNSVEVIREWRERRNHSIVLISDKIQK